MKTRFNWLKFIPLLCGAFAATTVLGQTTYTWTNNAPSDIGVGANYTPNGVPNIGAAATQGDTMLFNGASTGPVFGFSNTGSQTGSSVGGTVAGIYLYVGSSQTSPVTLYTTVPSGTSPGIRFNSVMVEAGSGGLTLGTGSTTNCLDTLWGTSNPQSHGITNNSSFPLVILPDMRWRLGAAGVHTFIFTGTGDFRITNNIANANNATTLVQKAGSGTMYWSAGNNGLWGSQQTVLASPMTLSEGTLVLNSGNLFPSTTTINTTAGALLKFDAVGGAQTIANPVTGGGDLQVNNGTLTLSGANTFTGNTTLSGGTLVANRAENLGVNGPLGNGGFISFTGGTLAFSSVNSYDYSPRFTNTANQSFIFDTAGQNVIFTNGLASSSGTLTKLGSGSLTLAGANTYNGITTVAAGKLILQGSQANGAIVVSNGAALGVTGGGSQYTPTTLALGTSSSATLEFNSVSSTVTPILAAGSITTGGTITINVNSGNFNTVGAVYPLFSWSGGSTPGVTLGQLTGAVGFLSTNANTIQLTITQTAFTWTGNNNGSWDLVTGNNWKQAGASAVYVNGPPTLFDDSAPGGNTSVINNALVSAQVVTFNNVNTNYTLNSFGGNNIGGITPLTKNNNGTLTLAGGAHTYTGATTINGGVVDVSVLANGGTASDIGAAGSGAANLVLNGGTLRYSGVGASSGVNRLFTLGTSGGTINSSGADALVLNNTGAVSLSGSGARTLTLAGTDVSGSSLAASLADSGGATSLTKSDSGLWIVAGNNAISGAVTINGGTLQVGNAGASGSVGSGGVTIAGGATLSYNRTGTVTNGVISGTGALSVDGGGTVVLPNNNSYSGGTTIASTSRLQVGTGGATGSLAPNANLAVEGILDFNTSGTFIYGGAGISGNGNVIIRGNAKIASLGANSYLGWTRIDAGSSFQPCGGNTGALASSVVTNNGTLLLVRQDAGAFTYAGPIVGTGRVVIDANNNNSGDMRLTGDSTYTGGTLIADNQLIVGDGAGLGSIVGNVVFTNSTQVPNDNQRALIFARGDDITFPGNITTNFSSAQVNLGIVRQNGSGILTLTGTNTYASGTEVNSGSLQVGNGGATGSVGSGPVALTSGNPLVIYRAGTLAIPGVISGVGGVVKMGTGTTTLSGANTYTGATTVSNGTLVVANGNIGGELYVEGGAYVAGGGGSVITNTVTGNIYINAGSVAVAINKSLAVSNTLYVSTFGSTYATGGSVNVTNVGPSLAAGEKFTLFSAPVSGGELLTIVAAPGYTFTNNLAVDGSITVLTAPVPAGPTNITYSVSGNQLTLTWPNSHLGWTLQSQTNTLATGLKTNWFDIAGSSSSTQQVITVSPLNPTVFFRLRSP